MTTVEILKRARQRIVDQGWLQGGFVEPGDQTGPCCASGAVLLDEPSVITGFASYGLTALCRHPELDEALTALTVRIGGPEQWNGYAGGYEACPVGVLAQWNDNEDRVVDDVLDLYDEAIDRLQKETTT